MKNLSAKFSNPTLLILVGASLWGGIAIFFNILSAVGLTQMQVVFVRVFTATICLLPYMLIKKRDLLKVRVKDCWCFVGTGIISLILFNWCYIRAIELTSLAVGVVLLYTSPMFVMLFSIVLFHEKVTARKLTALFFTFLGCVFVAGLLNGGGSRISSLGLLIGITGGIGLALYSIFGRYALQKGYDSMTVTTYTFLFAAVGAFPISHIWDAAALLLQPRAILGALGIGVLCTVFPFILYTKGLSGVDTSKASILATTEPAVAALLSVVLYHESLGGLKGIGILMIFGSVLLLSTPQEKKARSRRGAHLLAHNR